MRYSNRLPKTTVLALLITLGGVGHACSKPPATDEICTPETCGSFGTQVSFVKSPAVAAQQALKQEKLVFVLHVSGHFEKSQYT
jgi:hypothetical protein